MTYFHALGGLTTSDWCSAENPQPGCNVRGPQLCHPRYPKTLDVFRRIQEHVNALAPVKGFPKISVDGDIGPETVEGVNKALPSVFWAPQYKDCEGIAENADKVLSYLTKAAKLAGASVPSKKLPPSIDPDDSGSVDEAREALDLEPTSSGFLGVVTKPTTLIGIGLAAAGVWYLGSKGKRVKGTLV